MLRICFVKHGSVYDARYVNVLADMISRNLAEGTPGTFHCFTDDPTDILPHIETRPIPSEFEGWWCKLWLFRDGHFDDGDRIVYFDLDTVILGRLDEIVKYDGAFATLRDFFKPYDDVQSAVMAWPANTQQAILDKWNDLGRPILTGGDQQLIQLSLEGRGVAPDFWQDLFPRLFVSYKGGSYKRIPPRGCSVVCFHGQPKPHNCNAEWVNGVWRLNGLQAIEIEQYCNTADSQIAENIRHAMSLDFPWLELRQAHDGTAIIVGGAPSLRETFNTIPKIDGGVVFATNNTARFLSQAGIGFDYHVLVDAREENAGFLTERPTLGYLLASQCNRNIYDALSDASVTVWHPKITGIVELVQDDPRPVCIVGGGSTVCLKAIAIAYILGFRKFSLFGMDSSYPDGGAHHAYAQPLNDDDIILKVQVDDREFVTSPWMVAQADEFEDLIKELLRLGCAFEIAGDGLIPYILSETLKCVTTSAADERADAILSRLPLGRLAGAEIGVFTGELSSRLLLRDGLTLYMVDSWRGGGADYLEKDDFHASLTDEQQRNCMVAAIDATVFAKGRATIMATDSVTAASIIQDRTLDFVFIDADHSYGGCARDIGLWYPKLKTGGLLSGHDYAHPEFPTWGVKSAVDEWAKAHGYDVELGENFTWFIRLKEARIAA